MKITKTRLKEVILEVIKEEEVQLIDRDSEEIFDDIVSSLTILKDDESKKPILLGILDSLNNPSKNEGQHMMGGIDADDHEVEMALSDLHKLEKYAPKSRI